MGELDLCIIPATLTPKEYKIGLLVQDTEVGPKRSTTRPCLMLDKLLMALVELDLGLGPAVLPPIIQVIMVYHLVFIVMAITEVDICITPASFLHKTMVN